jgi:hypothetical protein
MSDDIYRKSTTNSITSDQFKLMSDAMASVKPVVPQVICGTYDSSLQQCVIGSGISNEKGHSEIDKWQDDVRLAIKDAIGKFPGAWVTCNKGDYCTTGKDLREA